MKENRIDTMRLVALFISVLMIVQMCCVFCSFEKICEGEGEYSFVMGDATTYPVTANAVKKSASAYTDSYYSQLDAYSKKIYDSKQANLEIMREGIEERIPFELPREGITVDEMDTVRDAFFRACYAFDYDHPEVFWTSKVMRYGYTFSYMEDEPDIKIVTSIYFKIPADGWWNNEYYTEFEVADAIAAFDAKVAEIVAEAGTTDYRKVKYYHDWLIKNNEYNAYVSEGRTEMASEIAWTAASALIGTVSIYDDPVCEGFARAFQALCNASGVNCTIISGTVYDDDEGILVNPGAHMWNAVRLVNRWFAADVTFDDSLTKADDEVSRDYFLKGNEKMSKLHVPNPEIVTDCRLVYPELYEFNYRTAAGSYLGDANCDNKVNSGDATTILRHAVGLAILVDDGLIRADFSCDRQVNTGDAVLVLRYIVS